MNEQFIFILGAHKSGTSLLRSLFDNHKDIFAIPIESHFAQHFRWWINYPFRKTYPADNIMIGEIIENFKQWIRHCNDSEDHQADSVAKNMFDISAFDSYIESALKKNSSFHIDKSLESYRGLIESYIKAIFFSIYYSDLPSAKRVVEKSVENAEFAIELSHIFPKSHFIHITRNPYANLVAIRRYKTRPKYPNLEAAVKSLENCYYFLNKNERIVSNYHIIEYEKLVTDTELCLKQLCESIHLDFNQSLLSPTYLGKAWKGNSTFSDRIDGISAKPLKAWKQDITHLEIEIINKRFSHILEKYGYEIESNRKSVFFPVKNEFPKQYIANRFLWKSNL